LGGGGAEALQINLVNVSHGGTKSPLYPLCLSHRTIIIK